MAAPTKKVFELFVSRIPWTLSAKELREYFGQFGHVKRCHVLFNKETGFHRGFCFVAFSKQDAVNSALEREVHMLEGAQIHIQMNKREFTGSRTFRESED